MHLYPQQLISRILGISVVCAIVASSLVITNSYLIAQYHLFATAITIDLLISLPLAYALLIRKSSIPKVTVTPVFLLSLGLAWYLLPTENRSLLEIATKYLLPLIEIGLLLFVVIVFVRTRRKYGVSTEYHFDVHERLRIALISGLPASVARAAAFELSVAYYIFGKWSNKYRESSYSYHRSGALSTGVVLMFLLAIETLIVHLVIGLWYSTAAWVVTAFGIYFFLQLFAHFKAVLLRPVEIFEDNLYIRCGLIGDAVIKLGSISNISSDLLADDSQDGAISLTPLGKFTSPNVRLDFENAQNINGIYGIQKTCSSILIHLDEPILFIEELKAAKSSYDGTNE